MAAVATLSYLPTKTDEARFWNEQQGQPAPKSGAPPGFPEKLDSPLAWSRAEIEAKQDQWVLQLNPTDVEAVNTALACFEESKKSLSEISAQTFPLPDDLARRLKGVSGQCYHGIGFQIVRGLNPSNYSAEQNAIVYAGIAAHVAPQRGFLDWAFERVLSHIVNVQQDANDIRKAPAFTDKPLSFHTDNCEIMGLYCLDTATAGGRTTLTSSWNLYNELVMKRPDVLKTLAEIWTVDTFNDYTQSPPVQVPYLDQVDGEAVRLRFSRYGITGFQKNQRNESLPPPTTSQLEAMDAVQFMASANSIALPMGKGDMVFVNDTAMLHAREGFFEEGRGEGEGGGNAPKDQPKRHLLKMYLRDPEAQWPIPESAKHSWSRIYGPNREDGSRVEKWDFTYQGGAKAVKGWQSNG